MRHGANINPPNRFGGIYAVSDVEQLGWDESGEDTDKRPIAYIPDESKTIVTENDSPDIGFRYSVNPYRGCVHGCSYCYARPYHEYLGYSAGLEFETKILVKHHAPQLLREFLAKDSWQPELIAFSGITDCYQPAEREFRLTRGCLEVAWECRQPVGVITKNALVVRDANVLQSLAAHGLAHVAVSVTTLDAELARVMEPRTSTPSARLRAIGELARRGIPVRVMVAPVIPGLNDSEIPAILDAAKQAGAQAAGYTLLRLPLAVEPVFREWLERTQPLKKQRVEHLVRQTRQGKLNDSRFVDRMRGTGPIAGQIGRVFQVFARKHGLDLGLPPLNCELFTPPKAVSGQLRLFQA